MAHNMVKGLDKMVSGRKLPVWHMADTGKDTTIANSLMTPQEALSKGIGDWEPIKIPAYVRASGDQFIVIPDKFAMTRNDLATDDPRRVLGIVGDGYEPIPNSVIVDLMEALSDHGARVDTAGTIFGGRRVYMTALLPGSNEVIDDRLAQYIVITSSHDGSKAFEVLHAPVRVVCHNTLSMAIRQAKSRVAIRHTVKYFNRIEEAAKVMQSASTYFAEHTAVMRNLAALKLTLSQASEFVKKLVPGKGTKSDNIRNRIIELYDGGQIGADQVAVKGTAYGLVNAFTQYIETDRTIHKHGDRSDSEARLDSVMFGSGATLRDSAMSAAVALLD